MSDSENDVDEIMEEEESEEGECNSENDEEDHSDECDPEGLFDALAAAREAAENYNNHVNSQIDDSCKLNQDFLLTSYKSALR